MRILLFLLPLVLLDWYIYQALAELSVPFSTEATMLLRLFFWLIPLSLLGWLAIHYNGTKRSVPRKPVVRMAGNFFMLIYLGKFVTAFSLLLGDLFRGITLVFIALSGNQALTTERLPLVTMLAVVMGLIPVFVLMYGMIRNRHRYRIFREKIIISDLPAQLEGLKIVQISDIHAGSFTRSEPVMAGVQKILDEQPDLVFFTGDLVNTVAREIEPYVPVFSKIKARYGVFSILGNHDYGDYARWPDQASKQKNRNALEDAHKSLGWTLLNNENEIIDIAGAKIAVIGVENFSANRRFSQYGNLEKAYKGAEGADIRLCLSHDPSHWSFDIVPNFPNIELTLSGHTHGGQFGLEIFNWKWSPVQYVYRHWAGLYQEANQYLYVNRGFGYLGYPGRVGILPEITVLELASA